MVSGTPYRARGRASRAGLDDPRADVVGYPCGEVPPIPSSGNGRLIMRRIIPALCAIVMLTAFTAPELAVADTDAILGQTCPEEVNEFELGTKWSCEGPAKDGKRHGNWVLRHPSGIILEGLFVDGKKHGNWIIGDIWSETVSEGPYVNDERYGNWIERFASGTVQEGPYVDGKRHGNWVIRDADGTVEEGPFVNGKRHGNWVMHFADGGVGEGPYVDGKQHGNWILRAPDGRCMSSEWSAGELVDGTLKDSC